MSDQEYEYKVEEFGGVSPMKSALEWRLNHNYAKNGWRVISVAFDEDDRCYVVLERPIRSASPLEPGEPGSPQLGDSS